MAIRAGRQTAKKISQLLRIRPARARDGERVHERVGDLKDLFEDAEAVHGHGVGGQGAQLRAERFGDADRVAVGEGGVEGLARDDALSH